MDEIRNALKNRKTGRKKLAAGLSKYEGGQNENPRLQKLKGFRGGMILLLRIILDIFLGLTGQAPLSSRHYFKY